jgi:lactate racemase
MSVRLKKAMQVHVAFGKTGLDLELPGSFEYRVLECLSAPPLLDAVSAIAAALEHPIAGPPLAALAAGKRSAAISVCDIKR